MQLSIELSVDPEDAEAVASWLNEEGADEVEELEQAGILPGVLVVVVGVIALSGLANVVIRLSRAFACGVIVDASGETIRTRKDDNLPRGTVIIRKSAGDDVTLREPSQVELADIVGAAVAGG